jgi:hypothetical protein
MKIYGEIMVFRCRKTDYVSHFLRSWNALYELEGEVNVVFI